MGGATADDPENDVVGIDEEELALFVEEREVVVGEIVAEELGAVLHAEWLEAVAFTPVAEREGLAEGVGVEEGGAGGAGAEVGG